VGKHHPALGTDRTVLWLQQKCGIYEAVLRRWSWCQE